MHYMCMRLVGSHLLMYVRLLLHPHTPGHLTKATIRQLAAAAGLPQATKRSSAGICFIGRRSFGRFLEAYLPPQSGVYVDVDSGIVLGPCTNTLAVTVGQKAAGLGGQASRVYVVGKDMTRGVVHVAAGHDHPALFSNTVLLQQPSWVAGEAPLALRTPAADTGAEAKMGGQLHCQYKARYRQTAEACSIVALQPSEAADFTVSRFCSVDCRERGLAAGTSAATGAAAGRGSSDGVHTLAGGALLVAELHKPLRGVAPGQMFVMYDGDVCLGSAVILGHGPTLFEQQHSGAAAM